MVDEEGEALHCSSMSTGSRAKRRGQSLESELSDFEQPGFTTPLPHWRRQRQRIRHPPGHKHLKTKPEDGIDPSSNGHIAGDIAGVCRDHSSISSDSTICDLIERACQNACEKAFGISVLRKHSNKDHLDWARLLATGVVSCIVLCVSGGSILVISALPIQLTAGCIVMVIGGIVTCSIAYQIAVIKWLEFERFRKEKGLISLVLPEIGDTNMNALNDENDSRNRLFTPQSVLLSKSLLDIIKHIRDSDFGIIDLLLSQLLPLAKHERDLIVKQLPPMTRAVVSQHGLIYLTPQRFRSLILPSKYRNPRTMVLNSNYNESEQRLQSIQQAVADRVRHSSLLSPISQSPVSEAMSDSGRYSAQEFTDYSPSIVRGSTEEFHSDGKSEASEENSAAEAVRTVLAHLDRESEKRRRREAGESVSSNTPSVSSDEELCCSPYSSSVHSETSLVDITPTPSPIFPLSQDLNQSNPFEMDHKVVFKPGMPPRKLDLVLDGGYERVRVDLSKELPLAKDVPSTDGPIIVESSTLLSRSMRMNNNPIHNHNNHPNSETHSSMLSEQRLLNCNNTKDDCDDHSVSCSSASSSDLSVPSSKKPSSLATTFFGKLLERMQFIRPPGQESSAVSRSYFGPTFNAEPVFTAVLDSKATELALRIVHLVWSQPFRGLSDFQLGLLLSGSLGMVSIYFVKSKRMRKMTLRLLKNVAVILLIGVAFACIVELFLRRRTSPVINHFLRRLLKMRAKKAKEREAREAAAVAAGDNSESSTQH